VLGVSAPVDLRSGQDNTGMDNMDQLAKSVNGRLPVAG